jgi:DNA-binding MarR family transcriptional regulator
MSSRPSAKRIPGPPPGIRDEIRKRLSDREMQGMDALFALRSAAQQVDNIVNEWLGDAVGSVARYQILMALWTAEEHRISHKDIGAAMGVTRATVSGLMAGLERDGFVKSTVDPDDRRKLIARLTAKGEAVIRKAFEANMARFRSVFASLSPGELTGLTGLLHRVRQAFAVPKM